MKIEHKVIIDQLGFKFVETQQVDAEYAFKNREEFAHKYANETHSLFYWEQRNEWSVKELSTTKTSSIISFEGIMYHYFKNVLGLGM